MTQNPKKNQSNSTHTLQPVFKFHNRSASMAETNTRIGKEPKS